MISIYKITRLVPAKVGITGIRRDLPLKPIEKIFPIKDNIYEISDGIKIDCRRRNEKLLFYYFFNVLRYYRQSPLFRYINSKLSNDHIFLDIGANLGFYSYLAKKICGCRVYVFEPEPLHQEYLKRNNHLFDRIFDLALAEKAGETKFYVAKDDNLGGSSLVMSSKGWEESNYSHSIQVKTQRLDQLNFDVDTIKRIKLIKIDVEGAEESVIKGMEGLLATSNFDIWCEVRGETSDRNPGSYLHITDFLSKFDYHPYIYDGKKLMNFSKNNVKQVFDILFKKNKE
jgi:FkbM family methyltransferase